jgi:hypothetical protein
MKRRSRTCIVASLVLAAAGAARAAADEPPMVVLSAGATGILHHNTDVRHTVALFSAEYRGSAELFRRVKPLVGGFATSDGQAYAHAGVYRDFDLAPHWILTPRFAAGAYRQGSKDKLGGALEFQSGVDLFYRLANRWRIGAALSHVSNAGIGDSNPGTETIALVVAIPLRQP